MRATLVLAVLAAAPARLAAASESSIACGRGIVSVGDTKLDLLGKCGPPTLRDAREESRGELVLPRVGAPAGDGVRVSATIEQWTYDFGPQRFTHVVTLAGGRVVAIERGGYGYARDGEQEGVGIPVARCDASVLRPGATKLDLLAKCGEPAALDRHRVERVVAVSGDGGRTVLAGRTHDVEVWSYNFGPSRFLQLVTLEDGKVVRVERGGYGYEASRGGSAGGADGR